MMDHKKEAVKSFWSVTKYKIFPLVIPGNVNIAAAQYILSLLRLDTLSPEPFYYKQVKNLGWVCIF